VANKIYCSPYLVKMPKSECVRVKPSPAMTIFIFILYYCAGAKNATVQLFSPAENTNQSELHSLKHSTAHVFDRVVRSGDF